MRNNIKSNAGIILLIGIFVFIIINCSINKDNEAKEQSNVINHKDEGEIPDEQDHEGEADHVVLSKEAIKLAGITIEQVALEQIDKKELFPGEVCFNEEKHSRVIPRFPGIVKKIYKSEGDAVRKGEILAKIQSNESLTNYDIISDLSGIVTKRDIAQGEFAGEGRVIFEIADLSTLWVHLNVFPDSIRNFNKGMDVKLISINGERSATCKVISIIPVVDRNTRNMTVRALLKNGENIWLPGGFVKGEIRIISKVKVPVVYSESIQFLNDEPVLFVPEEENEFHIVHIVTGRKNGTFIEITHGLKPGDKYVRKGSFEIKARIITSTMDGHAGHGH
ncbi:MAG: efflux RND transporter periplasmic adaptor subunit [Candidatus Aminicenantes bacterium]|nr:efflux RND transporter periplasmic adaptor subunit [Candidatus Aminicenantes bacterium]